MEQHNPEDPKLEDQPEEESQEDQPIESGFPEEPKAIFTPQEEITSDEAPSDYPHKTKAVKSETGIGIWLDDTLLKVRIYTYMKEDKLILLTQTQLTSEGVRELELVEGVVEAHFSLPTKKEVDRYRERAQRWNEEAQGLLISKTRVRNLLTRYHMKKLIVLGEDTGVESDENGALTIESEKKMEKLHPSILDFVMFKYENEAALTI